MHCNENLRLEDIYRLRQEQTRSVERGGPMFFLVGNSHNYPLILREHRAVQTRAANEIKLHLKSCALCKERPAIPAVLASRLRTSPALPRE